MPLILGTNSIKDTGFDVANSLRFNDGSSDNLTKNFSGTQDSRRKFTVSSWIKRSKLSDGDQRIWGSSEGSGEGYNSFGWNGSDKLKVLSGNTSNSGTQLNFESNQVFRDVSAWSHLVYAVDTTQGTESNRVKIYHNGTQITSWGTATYPSQNTDLLTSTTPQMTIGMRDLRGTDANFYSGYISEFVFIDNQQLTPTSFGEFDEDSGIFKPIDVSGLTFGTNGFYLETKQSGTSQNSSGLGADTSGNDNHFAVNNLTAIDQSTDTCTNNFATMNPLDGSQYQTLSEGNLKIVNSSAASSFGLTKGSIGVTKGKWYWEVKYTYGNAGHFGFFKVSNTAITNEEDINGNLFTVAGQGNGVFTGIAFRIDASGNIKHVFNGDVADTNVDFSSGDTLGLAFDGDSGKLYAFKNGAELTGQNIGAGTSLMSAVTMDDIFLPFVSNGDGGSGTKTGTSEFNFGSPPFAISSGNTDGDGYGNFEYAVPSGYYSLNTKNLAEYG